MGKPGVTLDLLGHTQCPPQTQQCAIQPHSDPTEDPGTSSRAEPLLTAQLTPGHQLEGVTRTQHSHLGCKHQGDADGEAQGVISHGIGDGAQLLPARAPQHPATGRLGRGDTQGTLPGGSWAWHRPGDRETHSTVPLSQEGAKPRSGAGGVRGSSRCGCQQTPSRSQRAPPQCPGASPRIWQEETG